MVKHLNVKLDGVKEEDTEDETVEGDLESFGKGSVESRLKTEIVKCCTLHIWVDVQTFIINTLADYNTTQIATQARCY